MENNFRKKTAFLRKNPEYIKYTQEIIDNSIESFSILKGVRAGPPPSINTAQSWPADQIAIGASRSTPSRRATSS